MTTDEHLERIESYLKQTLNRLDMLDSRLDILDSRLTTLAGLYQSLDARMSPLSKAVLDFGAIATRMQIEQSRVAKLVEPAA